ncbi:Glutathione S-transferase S1 [Linnemannia exigua]|uniref:glutathione transferase n=1 Tax=Linnemannia exigua TaxID=604196 RepID=A0AAD4H3U0_9FUNG|nr:Glutathione S-transferase S1 [Linnemannia exigua]
MSTTIQPRRPFFTANTSEENAAVLADPSATYQLMYLDIACVGATAREILAFGKATWSNYVPDSKDWNEGKIKAPFKVMPVLTITSPSNGKDAIIAESVPIDHYLARKFALLGSNEWEEMTIKALYNNIHHLRERSLTRVTLTYPEKRREGLNWFMNVALPTFLENHEFHLRANGSNGYYLGDKLSLAEIHLVNTMDHLLTLPVGHIIGAELAKSELLSKVRERVEGNPEISTWRASEEWRRFTQGSIDMYADSAPLEDGHEDVKAE